MGPDLFRVFDGLTSIRLRLVLLPYVLSLSPSMLALAVMGLSLFLRGFQGLVFPYVVSSLHAWVLFVSRVLILFGKFILCMFCILFPLSFLSLD